MSENLKKRDSTKRQFRLTVAALIAAAVLAVLYFALLRPLLFPHETSTYDLLDGEAVNVNGCKLISVEGEGKVTLSDDGSVAYCEGGSATAEFDSTDALRTAGRYYMFPALDSSDVQEISVENATGTYGFYYNSADGKYYMTGHKGTPYESTAFTTMLAAARDPMSMKRITVDAADLSKYGLDDEHVSARVTLTDKRGDTRVFLVGDAIVTGGGYYCTVPGRAAVYVLDTATASFLAAARDYVTPLLSSPVGEGDYYLTEEFTLSVDGEVFVSCGYLSDAERAETASTSVYRMIVPENYVPSSTNYGKLLQKFVEFKGTSTLEFGPSDEVLPKETLAPYGLDKPKYEIYYKYGGIDNYVYVSEKNENGNYYAFSLMYNLVAEVPATTLDFLEWEFIDFVDRPLFQKNINDVSSVRFEADGFDETFMIEGATAADLSVTPASTGKGLDSAGVENFRKIYLKMLKLSIEEYAPEGSYDDLIMRMTVKTDVGLEYVYEFYAYSTRRCYFTINGKGEFYCLRDRVEQIAADAAALMNGGEIDASDLG